CHSGRIETARHVGKSDAALDLETHPTETVAPYYRSGANMATDLYTELREQYIAAYSAGDPAGIAQTFTEDCAVYAPDGPPVHGPDGVAAFYAEQFRIMTPSSLSIHPDEEVEVGEMGYGCGTWSAVVTIPGSDAPVTLEGKYLNLLKRQPDGSWKL